MMAEELERNRQMVVLAAGCMLLNHIEVLNRLAEVRRQEDEEKQAERERTAKKRAKGPWTRNWILKRKEFGWYEAFLGELENGENGDPNRCTNFMRMEAAMYHEMVDTLAPKLQRKDTNYRAALPAGKLTLIVL